MGIVVTEEDTLSTKSEALRKENRFFGWFVKLELGVGGGLSLWGLYQYWFAGSYGWLIVGGIVLGLGISHQLKRSENKTDLSMIESGRSGEKFVTKLFREELPDNHWILNDLDVSDGRREAQNDHVVVTPAGLFVVETKAYAGRLSGTSEDEYWDQVKQRGNNRETKKVTNPIQQNHYHIEVLEGFLNSHDLPFRSEDIYSCIAMVNKKCEWDISGDDEQIYYAWEIPDFIKSKRGTERYGEQDRTRLLRELGVELPGSL